MDQKSTVKWFYFFILATCSIVGSSYVGLNGGYVWRQADVYANILGFLDVKGMEPFQDFFGNRVLYDMPIYQYIIAKISAFSLIDPLVVTRYVNLFFWALLMWGGGEVAEFFEVNSRFYFWALMTTSPLLLHYFATPLPDVMATSCAVVGLALLLRSDGLLDRDILLSALLFALSAFIKSPIPYVFIIFHGGCRLFFLRIPGVAIVRKVDGLVYGAAFFAAIAAEMVRKVFLQVHEGNFAQDPTWYFGTWAQRLSRDFWQVMLDRLEGVTPFPELIYGLFLAIACYVLVCRSVKVMLPFVFAYFGGWLLFSNVYFIHDYYEIPVTIIFLLASSIAIGRFVSFFCDGDRDVSAFIRLLSQILFYAAVPVLMIFGTRISDYRTESIFDSGSFALRDINFFLWVSDRRESPVIGGLMKTKFRQISSIELERNCAKFISENKAIIVNGNSACVSGYRGWATTYIEDGGLQIYVNNKLGAYPAEKLE